MKASVEKPNNENKSKTAVHKVLQKRNKKPGALELELPGIEADRPGIENTIQRAGLEPGSLTSQEVLQLHSTLGNQAVGRLLTGPLQKKENENKTGMPDNLKSGIEKLSGIDISDVQVHYHSSKPAQLDALAYTQGTEIHVAPGQERHLPHEAWHVVQQKQGRVKPTMQMKGVYINDDQSLEREAHQKGRALNSTGHLKSMTTGRLKKRTTETYVVQRTVDGDLDEAIHYIELHKNYNDKTLHELNSLYPEYTKIAEAVNPSVGEAMAAGFKVWAGNYKNKTYAYLFESRKALDHTYPRGAVFAALGVNTNLDPDITVLTAVDDETLMATSLELKSSDSGHDAVAKLVSEGLNQLKKRENVRNTLGVDYVEHLLVVNLNAPCNYPFTDNEFTKPSTKQQYFPYSKPYDLDNIYTQLGWNQRLQKKVGDSIARLEFTRPVEVRMQYKGRRYATATFP